MLPRTGSGDHESSLRHYPFTCVNGLTAVRSLCRTVDIILLGAYSFSSDITRHGIIYLYVGLRVSSRT